MKAVGFPSAVNAKPPAVLAHFHRFDLGKIGISSVVAAELADGVAKGGSARNLPLRSR